MVQKLPVTEINLIDKAQLGKENEDMDFDKKIEIEDQKDEYIEQQNDDPGPTFQVLENNEQAVELKNLSAE